MTILRRSVAWTLTLIFLAANLLVAFPAIAADTARVAVYNETFESGTGGFVAQGGEIKLTRGTDASGNHYIMVAVNPDKAEAVATVSRAATDAGRWGTEFFFWAFQLSVNNWYFYNGKKYEITFDGTCFDGTNQVKPSFGTTVLQMTGNTVWVIKNGEWINRNELWPVPGAYEELVDRAGWYDCRMPDTWLNNTGFGTRNSDGSFTGSARSKYIAIRTRLAEHVAQVMADNKFYCGSGTGTVRGGATQLEKPFGGGYQFTLSREDFYGDEAIFNGLTTDEEKNAKMDEYIYESDGKTLKTYSLGIDCSFLKSAKRIAAFKKYLQDNSIGYAIDNLTLWETVASFDNTVSVTGNGSVTLTGLLDGASVTAASGETKSFTVADNAKINGKANAEPGYRVDKVMYGDDEISTSINGSFTVSADKLGADKKLTVSFTEYKNQVTTVGNGSVTLNAGFGDDVMAAGGETKDFSVSNSYDITGKATAQPGNVLKSIAYGDIAITPAEDGSFTVPKDKIAFDKKLTVTFGAILKYTNSAAVTGDGSVTLTTGVEGQGEVTALSGETKTFSADDVSGITGKVTPSADSVLEKITYGGEPITADPEGNFTVPGSMIGADKVLAVSFVSKMESVNTIFVAANGSDETGNGSKDAPYATIECARDVIRRFKELPEGGVTVYVRGGTYRLTTGIKFTSEDSGTEKSPITYRAYNDEKVKFTGTESIDTSAIKKVTDETLLNRLLEDYAKDHLYMLDLKAQGVALPELAASGNENGERIYMNDVALINARWPNDDNSGDPYYTNASAADLTDEEAEIYNKANGPQILRYADGAGNRSAKWQTPVDEMFVCGCIAYLWFPQSLRIAKLDTTNKRVITADPSRYGQNTYTSKSERQVFFENIFEEIDQPGESYLDRENGILYFYPVGTLKNPTMSISRLTDNIITVDGASYLNFDGISVSGGRVDGYRLSGSHITVSNAVIHGMGFNGVNASGTYITIRDCDIYDCCTNGINIGGGDRVNLVSGGNVVTNNRIHSTYGLLSRCGQSYVGVGLEVSHNDFFDAPMEGFRFGDNNNIVIEYNDIHDVQLVNSDGGAIYAGRDISAIGNIIRYNYFHDIGTAMGYHGQQSIFMDDGIIGPAIYGNIMYKGGKPDVPLKTNGGQFHNIYQNIFIDSPIAVNIFTMTGTATTGYYRPGRWYVYLTDMYDLYGGGNSNLFAGRKDLMFSDKWRKYYMEEEPTGYWKEVFNYIDPNTYATAKSYYDKKDKDGLTNYLNKILPDKPTNNYVENVLINVQTLFAKYSRANTRDLLWCSTEEGKKLFADYDNQDFTLTAEGLAEIQKTIPNFEATDFSKIGVQNDKFGNAPSAADTEILGTPKVGKNLMANYSYSDPDGDSEGKSKIYWYSSNKADGTYTRINTGYGKYYTVQSGDSNKYIRYEIVPKDTTYLYGERIVSAPIHIDASAEPADKDELISAILEVNDVLETAQVGDKAGQYPEDAYKALEEARDEAMTVARDQNALQHQVNTAKTNLEDALYRFRSAENDPLASLDIDKISIDTLIADEDGWTTGAGDDIVIRDGSMIVGNGAATLAEYTAKNYKNAQFNFTMRAEAIDPSLSNARDAYVGIYLRQGKNGWCWENDNTASMLDLKQNLIQYRQYPAPADWGGAVKDDMIQSGEKIELGKTYLVAAGIYDTKVDGQVYLELSLDGKKIYSQVVLGTGMYGKEGHFAISAGENTRVVIAPAKADMTELNAQIEAAKKLIETAVTGEDYGQYPENVITDVKTELAAAETVAARSGALQYEADQAALALRRAVNTAKSSIRYSGFISKDGTVELNYDGEKAEMNVRSGVTKVDIQVKNGVAMPETTVTSDGMNMNIPSGVKANGNYRMPLAGGSPSGSFKMGDVSKVFASGASEANFDGLVRIVLKGEASKTIAYRTNQNTYAKVSKTITEDSFEAAKEALGSNTKILRVNVGSDAVLYTYMITEFVTYDPSTPIGGDDQPGGGEGGGGGGTTSNPYGNKGGTGGFYSSETTNPNLDTEFCFNDIQNHWAKADIMAMYRLGVVSGVNDTTFDPDRNITRAEFAALIARALKLSEDAPSVFDDVEKGSWYETSVNACAKAEIITGFDGKFRPNDTITRNEMAVIISNAYSYLGKKGENGGIDKFTDKSEIADWAKPAVDVCTSVGLISGMTDTTFEGDKTATRAQAASILKRLLDK